MKQAASVARKISRFTSSHTTKSKFFPGSNIGKAILDDLNTPKALAIMQSLITNPKKFDINQEISTFRYIFEGSKQDLSISKEDQDKINQLIKLRLKARENGDYQTADKIRDELNKMNVSIKDKNGKTEWEIL